VFSTYTPFAGNNPPTITNKDSVPTKVVVNSTITFTFNATDPDSDTLTWGKISGSGWLHLDPNNGTIYGTPSWEILGFNEFKIQVSDGKGGYDNHTFKIDVITLNNPPEIINKDLAPTKANVNSAVNFTFLATDLDGDLLTWSKVSGPEWLSIDLFNGTIYGTPSEENLGSNVITIEVSDGRGGYDNHTFTIKVEEDEKEDFVFLCLVLILILIILILIILSLLRRRKKEEEEETQKIISKEMEEEEELHPPDDEDLEYSEPEEDMEAEEKALPEVLDEEEPPPPDDE
jgi:cbb3-type cytochrome oxidase subunit 3